MGQVGHPERRKTVLPLSEEVAGAAELQVGLSNLEAVTGAAHNLHPGAAVLCDVICHQNAVALFFAPAYAPPELVELGQSEALCILNQQDCGVGNVYAYFDYSGADQ